VFNGLIEQYEIHLCFHIVILIEFLFHDSAQFGELFHSGVVLAHEGGEDDGFGEGVLFLVEVADGFGDGVFEDGSEESEVFIIDESILEYSTNLVEP
jgi:hypothetical protein